MAIAFMKVMKSFHSNLAMLVMPTWRTFRELGLLLMMMSLPPDLPLIMSVLLKEMRELPLPNLPLPSMQLATRLSP